MVNGEKENVSSRGKNCCLNASDRRKMEVLLEDLTDPKNAKNAERHQGEERYFAN